MQTLEGKSTKDFIDAIFPHLGAIVHEYHYLGLTGLRRHLYDREALNAFVDVAGCDKLLVSGTPGEQAIVEEKFRGILAEILSIAMSIVSVRIEHNKLLLMDYDKRVCRKRMKAKAFINAPTFLEHQRRAEALRRAYIDTRPFKALNEPDPIKSADFEGAKNAMESLSKAYCAMNAEIASYLEKSEKLFGDRRRINLSLVAIFLAFVYFAFGSYDKVQLNFERIKSQLFTANSGQPNLGEKPSD